LNKGDFIALINPGMALIFACAFSILWHHQRERHYVRLLVGGFVALSGAFFLLYYSPLGVVVSRLASNTLFVAAGIGLVVGALERYDHRPPYRSVIMAGAAGLVGFCYFYFVQPDLSWRILAMNFAMGGIALLFAAELRIVPDKKPIDRFLFGVILFWGLSFFPRPLLAIWFDGPYADYADFHQSLYWITLVFTGSLFMLLFALTMITAIALDVMAELRERSVTDSLSGLLNRRGFEEGVTAAFAARDAGTPATLIVCDIDRFKSINDRYGHAAGDRVIEHFAECLRGATEGQHLVGRVGGEEFALLLENADAITARLLAEGVRIAFSTATALGFPSGVHLTASFGIAEVSAGESLDDLFRRADQALYLAKNSGRDCVRVSPGPAKTQSACGELRLLAAAQ
jgi:diguanylate cyclase (GGDEF)-like protein